MPQRRATTLPTHARTTRRRDIAGSHADVDRGFRFHRKHGSCRRLVTRKCHYHIELHSAAWRLPLTSVSSSSDGRQLSWLPGPQVATMQLEPPKGSRSTGQRGQQYWTPNNCMTREGSNSVSSSPVTSLDSSGFVRYKSVMHLCAIVGARHLGRTNWCGRSSFQEWVSYEDAPRVREAT